MDDVGRAEEPIDKLRAFRTSGDRAVRNELAEEFRWLADFAAARFAHRGEPIEDLEQVAMLGLVKAIECFDPDYGATFRSFAFVTITGEIRRHFRDSTWPVHVSRRRQERYLSVASTRDTLAQQLKRSPSIQDLAFAVQLTADEVLEALDVGRAYRSAPLDSTTDDSTRTDYRRAVLSDDEGQDETDMRVVLRQLVAELPERERRVIFLRFFYDLTQSDIAREVGVSQVHVSRLLRAAMITLRKELRRSPQAGRIAADATDNSAATDNTALRMDS